MNPFLRLVPQNIGMVGIGIGAVVTATLVISFFLPRSVNFSFAQQNCFTSPTVLPQLVAKKEGKVFRATPTATISIAGYPLYSHTTCITPQQTPTAQNAEQLALKPLGIPFLAKNIHVSTGNLPTVEYKTVLDQPISIKDPLTFPLTSADQIFDYHLVVGGKELACAKEQNKIICDIEKLGLAQSATYTLAMQRVFNGKTPVALFEQPVSTVAAVEIASSSITGGQTVFDIPKQMTLTLNKAAKSIEGVTLAQVSGQTRTNIPVRADLNGQTVTVYFDKALERSAIFELGIQKLSSEDGGYLAAPFALSFATSGGPKVRGVNIGSSKVATASNVVITFDSSVSGTQNLDTYIKLEINGNVVPAILSRNGRTVTINPNDNLPGCTPFTVRVINGLQNEFGVSGGSAWQFNSRTICQTVFSIGSSVLGRSILAYRFGNGPSTVVFVGTTHGDEKSSTATLNSWIDYLEAHYDQIPANRSIIVIPNLNPDGYAASRRTNANNVDLNRNFPANNWKQGVTMPGGAYNPNGGGSAPLSEPESRALANYVVGLNPRLVLTYHAAAGVVMPNDAGDSVALAKIYSQKSNISYQPSSQTNAIFTYDTTGSFEEWLYDKHGTPAILVELWTKSSNAFSKNQNAMWHMATLP